MPHSLRENDQEVIDFVLAHDIKSVLDIGPGSGTYWHLLHRHVDEMDAIEVWEPYVRQFDLDLKYDRITVADVRHMSQSSALDNRYDLIILGDVLEHMTRLESIGVWAWASCVAHWGLISLPIVHWPQGAVDGNPYEEHVQDHVEWPHVVEAYGPFEYMHLFEKTATFIKEFA